MTQLNDIMQRRLAPGQTNIITGAKGSGKTYTAVSIAQHALEGDYDLGMPAVVVTNLLFGKVRKGDMPLEAYPEGVRHADTLADTFRAVGEILKEYGQKDVVILWLLDEAQNFMMADQNMGGENQAMVMFLANTRKFQMCNLFMSPSIGNFVPRVRCFPSPLEPKPGMCNGQWFKDKEKAARYFGSRPDWRDVIFYRKGPQEPFSPVLIHGTTWTKGLYKGAKAGEYSYDTRSTAGFSIGTNADNVPFDIKKFIEATSKGLSWQLADNIDGFFAKWDSSESKDPNQPLYDRFTDQCRLMDRMRRDDRAPTWLQMADWFNEPATSLKTRYYAYIRKQKDVQRRTDDGNTGRGQDGRHEDRAVENIQPNNGGPERGFSSSVPPERGGDEAR